MKEKNIKIRYGDSEYGWIERLGGHLGKIINQPILAFDEIWRGDIVRYGDDPEGREVFPVILEVVDTPYPCRTYLEYQNDDERDLLRVILAPLDAAVMVLHESGNGKKGDIVVAHAEGMDPVLLAEGVGIHQSDPEEDICNECRAAAVAEGGCTGITQEELNAIWAKYDNQQADAVTAEELDAIMNEYVAEIRQRGGEMVSWEGRYPGEGAEGLVALLRKRGWVVLEDPEGGDFDWYGYVVFAPVDTPSTPESVQA
ncbi:MAG: hypothetical protein WAN65_07590 [Candidatus Sulfotelmatobacter sp.]